MRTLNALWFATLVTALGLQTLPASGGHGDTTAIYPPEYFKRLTELNDRLVFIDLRPADEFKAGRLPGARSLPLAELGRRHSELPPAGRVVLYCDCPPRLLQAAYQLLWGQGHRNVIMMDEGFSGWARRGYPVER